MKKTSVRLLAMIMTTVCAFNITGCNLRNNPSEEEQEQPELTNEEKEERRVKRKLIKNKKRSDKEAAESGYEPDTLAYYLEEQYQLEKGDYTIMANTEVEGGIDYQISFGVGDNLVLADVKAREKNNGVATMYSWEDNIKEVATNGNLSSIGESSQLKYANDRFIIYVDPMDFKNSLKSAFDLQKRIDEAMAWSQCGKKAFPSDIRICGKPADVERKGGLVREELYQDDLDMKTVVEALYENTYIAGYGTVLDKPDGRSLYETDSTPLEHAFLGWSLSMGLEDIYNDLTNNTAKDVRVDYLYFAKGYEGEVILNKVAGEYLMSYSGLYHLLEESGADVTGDWDKFEFTGADGKHYGFSYSQCSLKANALKEKKISTEFHYTVDGEKCIAGNEPLIPIETVQEMTGLSIKAVRQ